VSDVDKFGVTIQKGSAASKAKKEELAKSTNADNSVLG